MISPDPTAPWLGQLPAGWRRSRIKNVAELSPRYSSVAPTTGEACTVVPMEFLSEDGEIDTSIQELSADIQSGLTLFERGDVLFAKITPCMENGKAALVTKLPTRYGFGSTEFHVLRPSKKIDGQFLYYALFNPVYRAYAAENMTGAAGQKRVTSRFLKDTGLFLPSFQEQKRLAANLDASCLAIDAAVAAKRSQLEILQAVCAATIQRVVTRGISNSRKLIETGNIWLNQIPEGWALVALKRVCEIQGGLTLGKEYSGSLIERPYLRVANVQDGHLDLREVTTIEVPPDVAASVELRSGDVLMTEGGDLDKLGRGYLWNGEISGCLHQNHIFAVRCFAHRLIPKFLTYLTASRYGRDYFEATGKRTTNLASTNSTKVGLFPLPLPKLEEQEKLLEYLDEELMKIRGTQAILEQQINALLAYRESFIHETVIGQSHTAESDLKLIDAHA